MGWGQILTFRNDPKLHWDGVGVKILTLKNEPSCISALGVVMIHKTSLEWGWVKF